MLQVRKNDQVSFLRLRQLRAEMERARNLLEMIKKREKLKRERLELFDTILDAQLNNLVFDGSHTQARTRTHTHAHARTRMHTHAHIPLAPALAYNPWLTRACSGSPSASI